MLRISRILESSVIGDLSETTPTSRGAVSVSLEKSRSRVECTTAVRVLRSQTIENASYEHLQVPDTTSMRIKSPDVCVYHYRTVRLTCPICNATLRLLQPNTHTACERQMRALLNLRVWTGLVEACFTQKFPRFAPATQISKSDHFEPLAGVVSPHRQIWGRFRVHVKGATWCTTGCISV